MRRHFRMNQWLPSTIDSNFRALSDPDVLKWVEWILLYCGYTPKGEVNSEGMTMLRFEVENVYPATRLVGLESQPGVNQKLLTYQYPSIGEAVTLFVDEHKTGPPSGSTVHVLEIPVDATINRNGFHFKN